MKYRTKLLILCLLCLSPASPEDLTVGAMINEVIADPGSWVQMCSAFRPIPPQELPIGGYYRKWTEIEISPQNFLRLRARRTEVIAEIKKRLLAITPGTVKLAKGEAGVISGKKPSKLVRNNLEFYLAMLQDLNGIEALDDLLALEAVVNNVGYYDDIKPNSNGLHWYPQHVQVLSTITALLKNERPELLYTISEPATYDKTTRNTIVQLARRYLKTTNPTNFRGARGMSPVPRSR